MTNKLQIIDLIEDNQLYIQCIKYIKKNGMEMGLPPDINRVKVTKSHGIKNYFLKNVSFQILCEGAILQGVRANSCIMFYFVYGNNKKKKSIRSLI